MTRLDLRNQGLTRVPDEVFAAADTLEILDLSGNQLDHLPDGMAELERLKILFCSNNQFTELPAGLGRCPSLEMVGFKANQISRVSDEALPRPLRWFILTDNQLSRLPDSIGRCPRLQKLMLAGNRLTALPQSLARCDRLELLRLSANAFETADSALPPWLLALPHLSWLAYAGNPFSDAWMAAGAGTPASPAIHWRDLDVAGILGEGASGTILEARWRQANGQAQVVAVKLFKAAMTSDGLPRSEAFATLAVGAHDHLVAVHGHVVGHPQSREGLVLSRIPADFRNLAGPPSFESCTRDVFEPKLRLPAPVSERIAQAMASVVAHIHTRGLLHGDLYAHNVLVDAQGHALLGDFGAASPLPAAGTVLRDALTAIDGRALAILRSELAVLVDASPGGLPGKPEMR